MLDTPVGDVELGVIPTGRGRDVIRNFGIAADPDVAIGRLVVGTATLLDAGVIESKEGRRHFLGAAGAGFDAEVARRTDLGRAPGTLSYLIGIFGTLRNLHAVRSRVAIDGRVWTGRAIGVVVANGSWYGGGMRIAPEASVADGVLEVIIFGEIGRVELVRWLPTVYQGTHLLNPHIVALRGRDITIEADEPLPVHVDGEVTATTPVRAYVRPGALRLRR